MSARRRMLPPLTTSQMRRIMASRHASHFIGVYPIDRLPILAPPSHYRHCHWTSRRREDTQRGYCFIVNMDPAHLPGSHWLAVYINTDQRRPAEIFDSYGRAPPLRLQHWLSRHCRRWVHNKRFIQGPLTALCGVYCVFVLDIKCTFGLPFHDIVKLYFSPSATENDKRMRQYLYAIRRRVL